MSRAPPLTAAATDILDIAAFAPPVVGYQIKRYVFRIPFLLPASSLIY